MAGHQSAGLDDPGVGNDLCPALQFGADHGGHLLRRAAACLAAHLFQAQAHGSDLQRLERLGVQGATRPQRGCPQVPSSRPVVGGLTV
jgi:hypothetical protein